MDRLVLQRKPIRCAFTKTFKTLNECLQNGDCDAKTVKVHFSKLERLSEELNQLDEKIADVILNEKDEKHYEEEYVAKETYKDQFDLTRIEVNAFLSNVEKHENVSTQSNNALPSLKGRLKLPKIELKLFGGEIKDWLAFWSQFKRIHDDSSLEAEDKFQYLIQATISGSRARDIVDSFPPTAENYGKVIDVLKNRFGREELLTEYYVRELLGLVVKNSTSSKGKVNVSQLYDRLESYLRALESIGMTRDKYAAMLFPLVESCIPEEILRAWLRNPVSTVADPQTHNYSNRLQQLLMFLKCEVEGEERISMARAGLKGLDHQTREKKYQSEERLGLPTASNLFSGERCFTGRPRNKERFGIACVFCEKMHESRDCFIAQNMTLSDKKEKLTKKKACFLCLKVGHRAKDCKCSLKCIVCGKKHFTIMCPSLSVNDEKGKLTEHKEDVSMRLDEKHCTNLTSQCCTKEILLQTLMVNLVFLGKTRAVRALIDSGAQRSYILKSTANELGFVPVGHQEIVHALFGGVNTKRNLHNCYNVSVSNLKGDYRCNLNVLDQTNICGSLPRLNHGSWVEEMLEIGISLSDLGVGRPKIELLIGADSLGNLLTGRTYKLRCGLVAVDTLLGWTVMGSIATNEGMGSKSYGTMVTTLFTNTEHIPDLWSLDVLGITDPYLTKSKEEKELAALQHFTDTVTINTEGRYEVMMPWVENQESLGNNREVAEKRLKSTTLKLFNDNNFHKYDSVFKLWEREGIIEQVKNTSQLEDGYFLPHRAVVKEQSTTKIRPVFDASSKQKGTLSLNDCLEKGPNLIELIPSVLMRFREKRIGVTSDIEKAFLQISVNKADCNYLKFLWWDNYEEKTLKVLQHCRVVFGVNCSPFLLSAVIKHHLDHCPPEFSSTAEIMKKSFYVDNCVTSVNTETDLQNFIRKSSELMATAKFNLRDWKTSCYNTENIEPTGVLGMLWDRNTDLLYCAPCHIDVDEPVTRRSILSAVHKVFDPIGFTCPVTLYPKLLLQESWESKLGWDSEVPVHVRDKFFKWTDELHNLTNVRIPRCISASMKPENLSLHIFCDASQLAFSAVVFWRSESEENVNVQLVLAKSRVAPLKKMTIPRLELMACCIGARLADTVKKSLDLKHIPSYYWTDSTTALYWIKNDESWGTFVQNRVKEIRNISDNWMHIPGQTNPADLPSRGSTVKKLIQSRWWEGPSWLKLKQDSWPRSDIDYNKPDIYLEKRKNIKTALHISNENKEENWYLAYFSKYSSILRMVAWMLRFVTNTRKSSCERMRGELKVKEISDAEKIILKQVQQESLGGENKCKLKSLCTFKDSEDLIRVQTKVSSLRDEDENFIFPIVLPNDHQLVKSLILQYHVNLSHAGVQVLLLKLREKFWVLKGRRTVREVISKCVVCRRHAVKPIVTKPVTLPEDRVKQAAVFEVTGIDLTGPLILRDGTKAWITVYTCAVYRAVHLELITSLSTHGFLLGFRRFIARRGRPKIVYSDNGTNFVGADNLFKTIDWQSIERESAVSRIQWKFIPPTAAWWGGWWERIVQMVKYLLRRVLGKASLNYEELTTVICDCESVINSRPLTVLSEDANDIIPLSPAMFLHDNLNTGVFDLDAINYNSLSKRLKYQQRLRDELRRRFRSEYLSQLVLKPNKRNQTNSLKINDVVIIGSDGKKRLDWPLARVIGMYPGKDGIVRTVRLKTLTGELVRPIQRVYPMEISGPVVECEGKNQELSPPSTSDDSKVRTTRGRLLRLPKRLMNFEL